MASASGLDPEVLHLCFIDCEYTVTGLVNASHQRGDYLDVDIETVHCPLLAAPMIVFTDSQKRQVGYISCARSVECGSNFLYWVWRFTILLFVVSELRPTGGSGGDNLRCR